MDHKRDCEEETYKDKDHKTLVAALMLYHVEDENKKEAEDCLLQKLIGCDQIKNNNYTLNDD